MFEPKTSGSSSSNETSSNDLKQTVGFECVTKSKVIIYWLFEFYDESKLNFYSTFNSISNQRINEASLTNFLSKFLATLTFDTQTKLFESVKWFGMDEVWVDFLLKSEIIDPRIAILEASNRPISDCCQQLGPNWQSRQSDTIKCAQTGSKDPQMAWAKF